ncbi:hypothetical protein ACIA5D_15155 [Actinoplanes sp. NPDC051513]|uniref:hypothetical protein n=1 Tax=Actinoplanes sp. NPDC051513 TaxID=3363908 RepID=UPI00379DFF93
MQDEPIDIDALRRRAREQRERQPASARTTWVLEFEDALREALFPRARLFARIMAAAGDPGLDERHDSAPEGTPRAWVLAPFETFETLSSYEGETFPMTHHVFLTLGPEGPAFHTAAALPQWQSVSVREQAAATSVVTLGEIETPSALGRVGLGRYADAAERGAGARDDARRFADLCERRMTALLWAYELTFPDRHSAPLDWDEDETAIILRAAKKLRRREMTEDEFVQWLDGEIDGGGDLRLPPLTGARMARALSRTTYQPQRRHRRNWRDKLVDDGEKGWQIGEKYLDRSETVIRSERVFVRRDGSGFRESDGNGADEYEAEHIYPPEVYISHLGRRGDYHRRGMTF